MAESKNSLRWLRRLCQGPTSELWLGQEGNAPFVAKLLRPYPGESEMDTECQFESEALLHRRLRSTGLFLDVMRVGEAPDPADPQRSCRFMHAGSIAGAALEQIFEASAPPMTPGTVAHLGADLLRSIAALETLGFANLGLDARGIFVTRQGKVLVFDLGHIVGIGAADPRWSFRSGWNPYRDPETYRSAPASEYSGRYATGIIMRRLLSPHEPFPATRHNEFPSSEMYYLELHACLELFREWGFVPAELSIETGTHQDSAEPAVVVTLNTQNKRFVVALPVDTLPSALIQSYPFWLERFVLRAPEEQQRLLNATAIGARKTELGTTLQLRHIVLPCYGEASKQAVEILRELAETHPGLH